MRYTRGACLILTAGAAVAALATVGASPALADCNYSGGTQLCSSGGVSGGSSGSFDPTPCDRNSATRLNDPLCTYYDDYDPQIYLNPPNRPVDPGYGAGRPDRGRPGTPGNRPGGGGGGGRGGR